MDDDEDIERMESIRWFDDMMMLGWHDIHWGRLQYSNINYGDDDDVMIIMISKDEFIKFMMMMMRMESIRWYDDMMMLGWQDVHWGPSFNIQIFSLEHRPPFQNRAPPVLEIWLNMWWDHEIVFLSIKKSKYYQNHKFYKDLSDRV